jgi:hypothetical protein
MPASRRKKRSTRPGGRAAATCSPCTGGHGSRLPVSPHLTRVRALAHLQPKSPHRSCSRMPSSSQTPPPPSREQRYIKLTAPLAKQPPLPTPNVRRVRAAREETRVRVCTRTGQTLPTSKSKHTRLGDTRCELKTGGSSSHCCRAVRGGGGPFHLFVSPPVDGAPRIFDRPAIARPAVSIV